MRLTNKHGLPSAFERFEEKNSYSKGDSDFSITTLIDSPQISHLKNKFDEEISEDVADRILAILGTATHSILEHGSEEGDITERRLYATIGDTRISGAIDRMSIIRRFGEADPPMDCTYRLQDYKTIRGTALVINPEGSKSWQDQLNGYAFLARENGFTIDGIEVIAIVRDWNHASVRRSTQFPKHAVMTVPIPLWTHDEQRSFFTQCVEDHVAARPRECTDEERWKGKKVFAVTEYLKNGGLKSKATRLFDNSVQAEGFIMDKGIKAAVVIRNPVPTRCAGNYCQVSQYCDQYQNE